MIESNISPDVTIIIPVYNEEAILRDALVELIDRLGANVAPYEIVIAENGSTDRTRQIGNALALEFPQVRMRHTDAPNYGAALRDAILDARGEIVVCDEIDLCDVDFLHRATALIRAEAIDLVVGSKTMPGANDRRPWVRRAGTHTINALLRLTLGFRGTDTHGLKAFQRRGLAPVASSCVADKDLFASELVIRAARKGLEVREIPVDVQEKRPPTVGLARRVPNVMKNLAKLVIAIRIKP
ncbi:MAG: glycosyltransferase [Polyangiales bacterium]